MRSCFRPSRRGSVVRGSVVHGFVARVRWPHSLGPIKSLGAHRLTIGTRSGHDLGAWSAGTCAFTDDEASEETCGFCVKIFRGKVLFMPRAGGTFTFTRLDPALGGHFAGSLSQVVLQEVTIDPMTQATTPVGGGLNECLSSFSWDVVME